MDNIVPSKRRPSKTAPAVTCYPWCRHQSGHTEVWESGAQVCSTADVQVVTSLHPAVKQADGTYASEYVGVGGFAGHFGEVPTVHVSLGENYGIDVSAAEARMVAAAMIAIADKVEAGR